MEEFKDKGIKRMPNEILACIFGFVKDPVLISQICKKLRNFTPEISVIPFSPNELTERSLSKSKSSHFHIKLETPNASNKECSCAQENCTCAQRTYLTSALAHLKRWHTLDLDKLSPKLCDFLLTTIAGIALTSIRPMQNNVPALYRIRIPHNALQLLEMINPDLTELIYSDELSNVPPPLNSWTHGHPWDFLHFLQRLERFSNLKRMILHFVVAPFIAGRDIILANTVNLPSLRHLAINVSFFRTNTMLQLLKKLEMPSLGVFELTIHGIWSESLLCCDTFGDDIASLPGLTHLTIDCSVENVGAEVIARSLLGKCDTLVELTIIRTGSKSQRVVPSPAEESWHVRCPLKRLRLIDCHDNLPDIMSLGNALRFDANWSNFDKIIFERNLEPYKFLQPNLYFLRKDYVQFDSSEFEEFLLDFREEMEGKVEWKL